MLISSFSRKCLNLLTVSRAITARWSSDHIKQFGQIRNSNLCPLVIWLPDIVSLWHISQFMISPQNGSDLLVFSLSISSGVVGLIFIVTTAPYNQTLVKSP